MAEETNELLKAILNRLEVMDAKIDSIDSRQQKMQMEAHEFRTEVNKRFDHIDRQFRLFDVDIDMINKKIADQDRKINRLKHS